MLTFAKDLQYAARLLRKTPAFSFVAVPTLALGIGANAGVFGVVKAALVNPLPFPDADRLVTVSRPPSSAKGLNGGGIVPGREIYALVLRTGCS